MSQSKILQLFAVVLFFIVTQQSFAQQPAVTTYSGTSFSFTLSSNARTSAGIFDKDGTLRRTLWSNTYYNAGTYQQVWDGADDEGHLVPDGSYDIKVLTNNVQYHWDGVLGNSSSAFTGAGVHGAFQSIHSMVIAGGNAYYATNYNEGHEAQFYFDLANPQTKKSFPFLGSGQTTAYVASDGTNVYWAGVDGFNPSVSFLFATRVSDNTEVNFANGTEVQATFGRKYPSAVNVTNNSSSGITGLAVQPTGDFLFVARKKLNEVTVLHKTTGAIVRTLAIPAPGEMATDGANNLWIIHDGTVVEKYLVQADGTLASTLTITNLLEPLALAVSPDNSYVLIADGGTSQQLKAFDNSSGSNLWVFGQAGGYINSPTIADDKFYFTDNNGAVYNSFKTFVAFQPDGSFWIGDAGNYKVNHYSSTRSLVDQVMYLPHNYSVVAVQNDPSHVFGEYLEYEVDYSKPLARNNGSWKLVRNWRASIPKEYYQDFMVGVFKSAVKLSNGKTYALLFNTNTHKQSVVELPVAGPVRVAGIELLEFGGERLDADGSLKRFRLTQLNEPAYWYKRSLQGFDGSGNPIWGAEEVMNELPSIKGEDPIDWDGAIPAQVTADNVLISFDKGSVINGHGHGYHLGGIKLGTNKWLWRTAYSTDVDYDGDYPVNGSFDIGNDVVYPGGDAIVAERNVFWNYHGEFWKGSQVNKWNHVYDNGLMVGQFGTHGREVSGEAPAEMAGNVFSISYVKINEDEGYIYHNDESVHSGIHRWKVSGLTTISEQSITVSKTSLSNGLLGQYYLSADLNNCFLKKTVVDPTVNFNWGVTTLPAVDIYNSEEFSVSWTGFVKPLYSEEYTFYTNTSNAVRLWIDGKLLIDELHNNTTKEFSGKVSLVAGTQHAIRLELMKKGGNVSMNLQWSSGSQAKQIIPAVQLFPSLPADTTEGINLLEKLSYHGVLQNNLYGWSRIAATEDYTNLYEKWWSIKTGYKTTGRLSTTDVFIHFRNTNGGSNYVTRSLGNNELLLSWRLKGAVNFGGNDNNTNGGGGYWDVLDKNDKIIARFYSTVEYSGNFPVKIYGNNEVIVNDSHSTVQPVTSKSQPIEIRADEDGIKFTYSSYPTVTATVYDPASDWRSPKTMRFYYWSTNSNQERAMDIETMYFKPMLSMSVLKNNSLLFNAKRSEQAVSTSWEIKQTTVDSFFIERSADGSSFYNLGVVAGKQGVSTYTYQDLHPLQGTCYYRLKVLSSNSSIFYSAMVMVRGASAALSLYPNPAYEVLNLSFPPVKNNGSLEVFTTEGRKLYARPLQKGNTNSAIDLEKFPSGIYLLRYKNDADSSLTKFIKQ